MLSQNLACAQIPLTVLSDTNLIDTCIYLRENDSCNVTDVLNKLLRINFVMINLNTEAVMQIFLSVANTRALHLFASQLKSK